MESLKEKLTDGIQSIFDTHGLNVEYETGDYESVICLDDAIACIEESEDITRLEEELQAKTDLLALVIVEKTGLVEENAELREALERSNFAFQANLARANVKCEKSMLEALERNKQLLNK